MRNIIFPNFLFSRYFISPGLFRHPVYTIYSLRNCSQNYVVSYRKNYFNFRQKIHRWSIYKNFEYSCIETVTHRIERQHREREKIHRRREKRSNVVTGAPTSSSPSSCLVSASSLFLSPPIPTIVFSFYII